MSDPALTLSTHVLRVTLLDVSPRVWRELRVPSALGLGGLHRVLQIAMGWEDVHLHEWRVGDLTYGNPDEESWGESLADETAAVLASVAPQDSSFRYVYDLGDGWEHLVEVLAVDPYDGQVAPVACLDGARAAPPEDCGGPIGYEHLLDALADPADEEHEELQVWAGEGFDPSFFDREAVNLRLEPLWRMD